MKKTVGIFIIFLAVFLNSTGVHSQTIAEGNLIYLTENYPPHNYMEDGKLIGVSVEILQLMWKKLGLPDKTGLIKVLPWARGFKRLEREPNIVLFAMGYSPERAAAFHWIGPYHSHSLYLIGKKQDHLTINTLEDAKGYKVGVVREDIGHQVMLKKGFPLTALDLSNNQVSLFKKLEVDRIDLICFMEKEAFKGMAKAGLNPDEYELLFEVLKLQSGFGFSKQVPQSIIDDFQGALNALVQEGAVDQILKKYDLR